MSSRRVCSLGCLLLIGALGACVNWRAESAAPAEFLANHPASVRVVRVDGSRLIIYEPRAVGDSIVGSGTSRTQHLAVALTDIRVVESSHTNVGASIGLGLGILLLVAVAVTVFVIAPAFARMS